MFRSCLVAAVAVLASGQAFGQIKREGPVPQFKPGDIVRHWTIPGREPSGGLGYRVVAVEAENMFVEDLSDPGHYNHFPFVMMELKGAVAKKVGVEDRPALAVGALIRPIDQKDHPGYKILSIDGENIIATDLRDNGKVALKAGKVLPIAPAAIAVKPATKLEPLKPAPTPPAAQGGPIAGEVVDGVTIRIPDGKGSWYLVPAGDKALLNAVRIRVAGGGSYTTCPGGNCGQSGFGYRR